MKSPKIKKALKALGIKQEKPKELKGHEDATKPFRFKPGDARLKKNQGARIQIVPPAAQAKQRKRMNELIADFQHLPLAKELATALGIQGEPTLIEAVVMSLFIQAIKGDTNATKLIQAVTEPQHSGRFPAGPPPTLSIVWVKPDGTRVRAQEERPQNALPATTELEFDFTGDGGEIEALPPFAQENKR